jgi:NTP pyrophosphatase (non-canonical NTP hydrolase)
MDIKELSQEMNRFVMEKGWYADNSIHPQTPRNLAISLCIEAAEILEHFQWKDTPMNIEEYAGELADVTLYLLQLASVTGVDLEKAVLAKLKLNYGRTWEAH